jgi:hypothetical protein
MIIMYKTVIKVNRFNSTNHNNAISSQPFVFAFSPLSIVIVN